MAGVFLPACGVGEVHADCTAPTHCVKVLRGRWAATVKGDAGTRGAPRAAPGLCGLEARGVIGRVAHVVPVRPDEDDAVLHLLPHATWRWLAETQLRSCSCCEQHARGHHHAAIAPPLGAQKETHQAMRAAALAACANVTATLAPLVSALSAAWPCAHQPHAHMHARSAARCAATRAAGVPRAATR